MLFVLFDSNRFKTPCSASRPRLSPSLRHSLCVFHLCARPFIVFDSSSPPPLMASHCPFLAPRLTTLCATLLIRLGVGWGVYCCVSFLRFRLRHPSRSLSVLFCLIVLAPISLCSNSPCIARFVSHSDSSLLLTFPHLLISSLYNFDLVII